MYFEQSRDDGWHRRILYLTHKDIYEKKQKNVTCTMHTEKAAASF